MRNLFPFKTALVVGLCCYLVVEKPPGGKLTVRLANSSKDLTQYRTEFYPFSAFPMYGTFADVVFFTFLTDEAGQPIALSQIPHATASHLTKDYNQYRDAISDERKFKGKDVATPLDIRQAAGRIVLRNLMTNRSRDWFAARPDQKFVLHEGTLREQDGKVVTQETKLIAVSYAELMAEGGIK
jgi:hypothetical protein